MLATTRPELLSDAGHQDQRFFTQTPRVEYSDEGSMAITSIQDRMIADVVNQPTDEWGTFGPLAGLASLMNCTRRSIEWFAASIGHPKVGPLFDWAVADGQATNIVHSEIVFRKALKVESLMVLGGALTLVPPPQTMWLVFAENATVPPTTLNVSAVPTMRALRLAAGGWFGLVSPVDSAAHIYIVSGDAVRLEVTAPSAGPWLSVFAPLENKTVSAGDRFHMQFTATSYPVTMVVATAPELVRLKDYLVAPTGLVIVQGLRLNASLGLVDVRCRSDDHRVELKVPQPAALPAGTTLPLRVQLHPHWTAGLFQVQGHSLGHYYNSTEPGRRRYSALGLDFDGMAHVPLYVGRAALTHVIVGHPVVAKGDCASELRIQVTRVNEEPSLWHVAVNNPTDRPIGPVAVSVNMPELPGLALLAMESSNNNINNNPSVTLTLAPGELCILT